MKTLLVPVDFTATCENAVNFAAGWSKAYAYDRIILLKTFYESMFEHIGLAAEYVNLNEGYLNREREHAREQMEQLCRRLTLKTAGEVKIITAISELPLLRAILEVVEREQPELIIAGSDNYNHSSDSFIAANLISIAKASPVRVLIVPADYSYVPVTDALVPFDFNALSQLDKLKNLKTSAQFSKTFLQVLNVDAKERYLKPDEKFVAMQKVLSGLLANFDHKIHYANDRDVINGIMNFIKSNPVQLIIALPGKHSFLYNLTHKSISEAIYRNARQPVLILK